MGDKDYHFMSIKYIKIKMVISINIILKIIVYRFIPIIILLLWIFKKIFIIILYPLTVVDLLGLNQRILVKGNLKISARFRGIR
jgi:hypothetical protein